MDDQRFDDLARVLGLSLDRKRFVAAVGALFAAPGVVEQISAKKRGKKRKRGKRGVGGRGVSEFCEGFCESDNDCAAGPDCFCNEETNQCVILTCGGTCTKSADCPPLSGCDCVLPVVQEEVGAEGPAPLGECRTQTCGGSCVKHADCADAPGCICDQDAGQCVTVLCGGECGTSEDCGGPDACLCISDGQGFGLCTLVCKATCTKQADCPPISGCVCDTELGSCIAPPTCPGSCATNAQCTEQGADDCVCFLGVDTADAAQVERVVAEGTGGRCGVCRGIGERCDASTECCGQLVCGADGPLGANGFSGTCQRKPKPGRRCHKHGGACRRDSDCCAQASCYKGKCGEKDTHCHNDSECAAGWRCQGGPLSPGHRRCRKNGRRNRNRRNKNGSKR